MSIACPTCPCRCGWGGCQDLWAVGSRVHRHRLYSLVHLDRTVPPGDQRTESKTSQGGTSKRTGGNLRPYKHLKIRHGVEWGAKEMVKITTMY